MNKNGRLLPMQLPLVLNEILVKLVVDFIVLNLPVSSEGMLECDLGF